MQKTYKVILLLFLVTLLLSACNENVMEKPESFNKIIDDTVILTEKAIQEKDIELAREIWSKISEYGIKAREYDKEELSNSLGKLASTYTNLIDYLQEGDNVKLERFKSEFDNAVKQLKAIINKEMN